MKNACQFCTGHGLGPSELRSVGFSYIVNRLKYELFNFRILDSAPHSVLKIWSNKILVVEFFLTVSVLHQSEKKLQCSRAAKLDNIVRGLKGPLSPSWYKNVMHCLLS